ncbi:hypothetical protein QJS66_13250 [Kocuria rhizophila]|nr:hypothetical protein QJS66_13250 [Kocuria rhizophila]
MAQAPQSIVAGRLAEAGHHVTLVEAGGEDTTTPAIPHLSRLGELAQARGLGLLHRAGRRLPGG